MTDGAELIRLTEPLAGDYDPEERASEIPTSFVLKGMFFARLVERAGASWDEFQRSLEKPPKRGRYVAFYDYPQADYERLAAHVARKMHPKVGLREATRRLARDDFDVFAASTLGRVMLAVIRDARSALLRVPFVYSKVAPGEWQVRASDLDERTVRIDFVPNYGTWEYQVGQLEGIVLAMGGRPTLRVTHLADQGLRFDVSYA
jgi:uncharacterized protein (TIGR02265 family)